MKIAFRNFFRNRTINFTLKSIKYFLPEAEFHCASFFKESADEYKNEEPLDPCIKNTYLNTRYIAAGNKPSDSLEDENTSGYACGDNGFIFSEGYNAIFDLFQGSDEKVLILGEDHFFTNGRTLRELTENEFDLALAPAWNGFNGSILCLRPSRLTHVFPITDYEGVIEDVISRNFYQKIGDKIYLIKSRKDLDYFGDGFYTNSSEQVKQAVDKLLAEGPYDSRRGQYWESEK